MDLHTHTGSMWSQLDTLLLHVRTLLTAVEEKAAISGEVGIRYSLQHLRNAVELVERSATGFACTVEEMLPVIARLADAGEISPDAAEQILAPAYDNLGDEYTDLAMAYPVAAQAGEHAQNH